ncbi:MAG: hypothetical protein CMH50_15010 [Myxococcales bacterium]|nr:hypothetical protein [Myxococcales bacterium]
MQMLALEWMQELPVLMLDRSLTQALATLTTSPMTPIIAESVITSAHFLVRKPSVLRANVRWAPVVRASTISMA